MGTNQRVGDRRFGLSGGTLSTQSTGGQEERPPG